MIDFLVTLALTLLIILTGVYIYAEWILGIRQRNEVDKAMRLLIQAELEYAEKEDGASLNALEHAQRQFNEAVKRGYR